MLPSWRELATTRRPNTLDRMTLASSRVLALMAAGFGVTRAPVAEAQASAVAMLPFEVGGTSTIVLSVRVNESAPLRFILDSGASSCVIDRTRAQRLGLRFEGKGEGHGAGRGTVPYRFVATPVAFRAGQLRFGCERVVAIDLSGQRAIFGFPVDGILGHDFFSGRVVQIDFDARIVRLYDPSGFRAPPGADTLPLDLIRRLPYVTAVLTVPGRPPQRRALLLDTGSEDAVDDSIILASPGPKRTVTGGVGLGQEYQVVLGLLDSVQLGRVTLRNVPGVAPGVALVGTSVLHKFFVTLDYPRARLYLVPDPQYFPDLAPALLGSGLTLRGATDGGVLVHEVFAGSPGGQAGILRGDRIVAVDGSDATVLGHLRLQKIFDRPGTSYVLLLRRGGRTLRTTLAIP